MSEQEKTLSRVPRRTYEEDIRHRRRLGRLEAVLGFGIPGLLVLLWQVSGTNDWIDTRLFPTPTEIVREGWEIFRHGRLKHDIAVTFRRILSGYAVGCIVGFSAGLAMGLSRLVRRAFEPILNAFYVVPKIALLPVILTIFGFGEAPKVVLVATTVFFFVWIQTMEAMVSVPDGFREAARSLGMTRIQTFRHVLLPAALQQLFVGLRIAMGVAVLVNVAAEFIVGDDGLGNLIFTSRALFINEWVYVGIVTIATMGVLLTAFIDVLGKRLTPWVSGREPSRLAGIKKRFTSAS